MAEKMGVVGQPLLPVNIIGAHDTDGMPEPRGMVHLFEMSHFVGNNVIEDGFRAHNQPPGKIQCAFAGT